MAMAMEIGAEHVLAAALVVQAVASIAGVGLLAWAVVEVGRIRRQGEPSAVITSPPWGWPTTPDLEADEAPFRDVADRVMARDLADRLAPEVIEAAAKEWADREVARQVAGESDMEPLGILGDSEAQRAAMVVAPPAEVEDEPAAEPAAADPALRCGGKNKHHQWSGVSPDRVCKRCQVAESESRPSREAKAPKRPATTERATAAAGAASEPRPLICAETHDRHSYDGQKGDPVRHCERCGAVAPKYASGRAVVTTAEQAAAWRDGRFPATSGPESRPPARREDGTRNRAALRGGATEDLTVGGELAAGPGQRSLGASAGLVVSGLPGVTSAAGCPKCRGVLTASVDEFGEPDTHCVTCGYRPVRTELPEDDPYGLRTGKARRREPSHGGARI
jgi:hypothetical protein